MYYVVFDPRWRAATPRLARYMSYDKLAGENSILFVSSEF